jgi:hypothetical protein
MIYIINKLIKGHWSSGPPFKKIKGQKLFTKLDRVDFPTTARIVIMIAQRSATPFAFKIFFFDPDLFRLGACLD